MNFSINYSSIKEMLNIFKMIKDGENVESELDKVLEHDDYKFEFSRYEGRVSKEQFKEYILNIKNIQEGSIKNDDLKAHHKYYEYLLDSMDVYDKKEKLLKDNLTKERFEEQIRVALSGLPEDIVLPEMKFVFTIGIGQSFGYVHGSGMHFDFLQLVKDKSLDEFLSVISHEVHHVGMNIIHESLDLESISSEELFYVAFTGEGLAVKYCNNGEGILTKSIYDGEKNIGMDPYTWQYLNSDFDNAMAEFKKTIENIRSGKIKNNNELMKHLQEYWMNPRTEEQSREEIPKLKQFRLYSFGNDIWGIIHDCFGKEIVYKTLRDPKSFPSVFNDALEVIGRIEFKI